MEKATKRFILVDDDALSNLLSCMALKRALGEVDIKDFLLPEKALDFIQTEYDAPASFDLTTLFLDINMPTLSGWEFLDVFNGFSDLLKEHFSIYILSSSIDTADIDRAKLNPLVMDFIEKPLQKAFIVERFGRVN